MSLPRYQGKLEYCARKSCTRKGTMPCVHCKLVLYCNALCAFCDCSRHTDECDALFSVGVNWKPTWNHRKPPGAIWNFQTGGIHSTCSTNQSFPFLGRMPAQDIMKLADNEGIDYAITHGISLMFAGSADLRNLVKTVSELPDSGGRTIKLHATVSDYRPHCAFRNIIIMLFILQSLQQAGDCSTLGPWPHSTSGVKHELLHDIATTVLHLWYSPFLTTQMARDVRITVMPLIWPVAEEDLTSLSEYRWIFHLGDDTRPNTIHLTATPTRDVWRNMAMFLQHLPAKPDLDAMGAQLRHSTMSAAPVRKDYLEQRLYRDSNRFTRIARQKYCQHGILLPFTESPMDFSVPNLTFFFNQTCAIEDDADPLSAWPLQDVYNTTGRAENDLYGKLYTHIHNHILKFLTNICMGIEADFHMHSGNLDVFHQVEDRTYDRIEVTGLMDEEHIEKAFRSLSPLLRNKEQNRYATFITCHMQSDFDRVDLRSRFTTDQQALGNYFPVVTKNFLPMQLAYGDLDTVDQHKADVAVLVVANKCEYVYSCMAKAQLKELGRSISLVVKVPNTVVKLWPTAMELQSGDPGAREEFERLMPMIYTGAERYMEWKRT